MRTDSFDKR